MKPNLHKATQLKRDRYHNKILMASLTYQILAALVTFVLTSPCLVRSGQIQINLSNDLNDGLHFKGSSTKGKDLGVKVMGPGTNFTWGADTDEQWCTYLRNGSGTGNKDGLFMVFVPDRDIGRCGQECLWSVRDDGIYLYIGGAYIFQFRWGIDGCW